MANRLSNLATGLVTVGVVARTQGEDRFGVWSVVVAVATGLMVADLGLGNALVRESGLLVAEGRRSGAVGLLATARRRVMLVVALPAAAAATVASTVLVSADVQVLGLSGWDLGTSILAVGLVVPLVAVFTMATKVRLGLGEVAESSVFWIVGCAVQVVVILGVARPGVSIGVLVAANFTSNLVGGGLDSLRLWRSSPDRGRPELPSRVTRNGRRYAALAAVVFAGFGADSLMVGILVGPVGAGLVALAARVVLTPSNVLQSWFTPSWGSMARVESRRSADLSKIVWRTVLAAAAVTTAASLAAGFLAEPLTLIVAGPGYVLPPGLLWATVAAGVVMGVGGALALPMNALGLVSGQLRLGTISAVCNVVLGTVLCLTIGAAGAPLATAVAHGVVGVPLAAMAVRERLGRPAAVSGTAGRFPP